MFLMPKPAVWPKVAKVRVRAAGKRIEIRPSLLIERIRREAKSPQTE